MIHLPECVDVSFPEHLHKLDKDFRGRPRVIHSPVVILQRDSQCFRHNIQLIFGQRRKEHSGKGNRIHIGKLPVNSLISAVFLDKSHVESGVVSNKDTITHKLKELRKDHFDRRRIHDHLIRDTGQVCDLKGNGALRIYESAEPVHDLAADNF